MLVLTCRPSEAVILGDHVEVRVVGIRGRRVRLAFNAPPEIPIVREALLPGLRRPSRLPARAPRRCA